MAENEKIAAEAEEAVETQEIEQGSDSTSARKHEIKAASGTALRDLLKTTYNLDLGDDLTDEDLAPRIGKILGENQSLQKALADSKTENDLREKQLSEYLEAQEDFQQFRQAKQKEAATSQEAQQKPQWKALDYDPEWEIAAEFDKDTRRWVPKRKFGAYGFEAAEHLNSYAREQAERARRLTSDPWSLVREAGAEAELQKMRTEFEDRLKKTREEVIAEFKSQQQTTKAADEVESWADTHASDLFEADGSLTVLGRIYRTAAEEAYKEYGIEDKSRLHKYALKAYEAATKASEKPEKTTKDKGAEQKKKFLDGNHKGANRITNRDGTLATAKANGEAPNKFLDFRQMVLTDPDNSEYLGDLYKG